MEKAFFFFVVFGKGGWLHWPFQIPPALERRCSIHKVFHFHIPGHNNEANFTSKSGKNAPSTVVNYVIDNCGVAKRI